MQGLQSHQQCIEQQKGTILLARVCSQPAILLGCQAVLVGHRGLSLAYLAGLHERQHTTTIAATPVLVQLSPICCAAQQPYEPCRLTCSSIRVGDQLPARSGDMR